MEVETRRSRILTKLLQQEFMGMRIRMGVVGCCLVVMAMAVRTLLLPELVCRSLIVG